MYAGGASRDGAVPKISEGTNEKNRSKKLDVSAGLQEYLENIKLLRTTEAMGDYQQGLCKR